MLSVAAAWIVTVPETVWPPVGDVIETTGGVVSDAGATATVTDFVAVPLAPVHVSVYVLPDVKAPVLSLPESGFEPDHEPEAVQEFTPVEDQESVEDPP